MTIFKGTLHALCEEGKWSEVKLLVQGVLQPREYPPSESYKDWTVAKLKKSLMTREGPHEWTPLMISCVRAPLDVIALICHAQPRACLLPDKSGSLPVHFSATFRRGAFVEVLLKILCEASPPSLEVRNAWGQTPLHSLLDAKQLAPIGCLRVLLDQGQYTEEALQLRDKQFKMPLHIAATKNLPVDFLQALVESYREACFETDRTGSLPCQILHAVTDGQAAVGSMEALLVPLAIGSTRARRRSTMGAAKPSTWSQLLSLTKQAAQFHENQPLPPISPRSPAQDACRIAGNIQMLPLHLAAHYGVKLEILKGVCRQFPEGAKMQIVWKVLQKEYGEEKESNSAKAVDLVQRQKGSQNGTHPSTIAEEDEEEEGENDLAGGTESKSSNSSLSGGRQEIEISSPGNGKISTGPLSGSLPIETQGDDAPWEEESLRTPDDSDEENFVDDDELGDSARNDEPDVYETQADTQGPLLCALEIFERGLAFRELNEALIRRKAGGINEAKLEEIRAYYERRSDLLLAYHTEAMDNAEKYIDFPDRIKRLETQIIREAKENGQLPLSDTVVQVWTHLAGYSSKENPKKYIRSVGRIVTSLGPSGLWKLTVVPQVDRDVFVKIAATGRTIVQEAELRAPAARMEHVLKFYWFQYLLCTYLEPLDALSYSMCCRYTRAGGVRLLPQVPLRVTAASWKKPMSASDNSPPKPWQRLDVMVTPDCTHSIYVTYYVETKDGDGDQRQDSNDVGGMLVVRDDNRKLRPNMNEPWGSAVVAYCKTPPVSGSLVRISFQHLPGRSYGLWHYSRGGPGSCLSVSDVRVRQLLHSCDPRGRSPLHLLLSSMVDQPTNPKLNMQVSMLLAAKFGSGDSVGDVPLHYALKCGVSEDVLTSIITASPAALVDTDKEGRTPIHAAFLLSKDEPPALGVIRALLTPPGENAIRLKDSSGRLPIHIAAERGAGEAVLRMLVEAYQDGCYRTNKTGDLPLHLLLKSGTATTTTVELLIRPMMQNETICKLGGAHGTNLPLHIAAEYQCSFKVLERLLQTHGDAALVSRQVERSKERAEQKTECALDIFESGRDTSTESEVPADPSFRAKEAVLSADFLLRSDLIFVYNPLLINRKTGKPYRGDRERIRRLENMIRREASQCGEDRKINRRAKLSDMARQGWIFLCTYHNAEDPRDNFAGTVRRILRGLSSNAVDVLAHAENPKSIPTPNMLLKDCATPVCQLLIMSRLRFVGRYALYDEIHPVHKSESCLVMRAKDHGLEDEYKKFMTIYDAKENQVEDDISDAGSEPPEMTNMNDQPNEVTVEMFVNFAVKIGVKAEAAREEILNLLTLDSAREDQQDTTATGANARNSDDETFSRDDEMSAETKKQDPDDENGLAVGKEAFTTFCRAHRLNEKGVRTVVIKFMKNVRQFKREIEVRACLDLNSTRWPVVPILDHYNVDRIEASRRKDIDIISLRDDMAEDAISGAPENRDELYALDIQEKNASVHNFALYKYAVVMAAGDRDLGEICQHEELGILQIREYMLQVGTALQSLHGACKCCTSVCKMIICVRLQEICSHLGFFFLAMIHGDLKMENVVRFGKNLALIDFDGAYGVGSKNLGDRMGGGASKFCTGVLPPEMVTRIDLVSDFPKLTQYEDYWRRVSEDAKDVNLLTPDDIQTISSVTKSLLAKADVARNLRKTMPRGLRNEMNNLYSGLEDRNDWKDILSVSLMTLSFDDLPFSLNRCQEVDEFAKVWNRLLFHAKLWNKVKPRITPDEKYAYLIKTHNDIPDDLGIVEKPDSSKVPYALVEPSEAIDVWGFGVLLFALCSGGTLFHLGFDGDLHDSEDYVELFEWSKQKGERIFRDKVEDPLAQDLLQKILVPEDIRLPSLEAVLKHPFFGPSSSVDAQHILERHEEEQLIDEETVVIKRMTNETRRRIERSMERQCKIIFDEDKVVVPTCLIVVPYKLVEDGNILVVKSESALGLAVEVGRCLLEINKITAQLSFYLMLKRSLGQGKAQIATFKAKFKGWVKRTKTESMESVCKDIVRETGCGREYATLCREVVQVGEAAAVMFFQDPIGTARQTIRQTLDNLLQCYQTTQNLYLVDEMNGVPVRSEDRGNDDFDDLVYPIAIDKSTTMLKSLFLPFINIAVMKLTASEGLSALAKLLGLPKSYGVPESWESEAIGLVHRPEKPSGIAEFAVLHEVIRRQEMIATPGTVGSLSKKDVSQTGDEMGRLEDFFRDFDPVRTFADLHRVSDGREGSPAIWTTETEVNRIQGELELASAEFKLRELKKEWIKRQKMQEEIQSLTDQVGRLQGKPVSRRSRSGNGRRSSSTKSKGNEDASADIYQISDSSSPVIFDPERAAEQSQVKRQKMRLRPYFGVC